MFGFLESYFKDYIQSQTSQNQFFISIDPKNKKKPTKYHIPRNSDLQSFSNLQDELFKSLETRHNMKKHVMKEFEEKMITKVQKELKQMSVTVPSYVKIELEKGRVLIDTS